LLARRAPLDRLLCCIFGQKCRPGGGRWSAQFSLMAACSRAPSSPKKNWPSGHRLSMCCLRLLSSSPRPQTMRSLLFRPKKPRHQPKPFLALVAMECQELGVGCKKRRQHLHEDIAPEIDAAKSRHAAARGVSLSCVTKVRTPTRMPGSQARWLASWLCKT